MNILEHYILKIYSKTPIEYVDIDEKGEKQLLKFLKVKMRVVCYGSYYTTERLYFSEQELEEDLARGYYLA